MEAAAWLRGAHLARAIFWPEAIFNHDSFIELEWLGQNNVGILKVVFSCQKGSREKGGPACLINITKASFHLVFAGAAGLSAGALAQLRVKSTYAKYSRGAQCARGIRRQRRTPHSG